MGGVSGTLTWILTSLVTPLTIQAAFTPLVARFCCAVSGTDLGSAAQPPQPCQPPSTPNQSSIPHSLNPSNPQPWTPTPFDQALFMPLLVRVAGSLSCAYSSRSVQPRTAARPLGCKSTCNFTYNSTSNRPTVLPG